MLEFLFWFGFRFLFYFNEIRQKVYRYISYMMMLSDIGQTYQFIYMVEVHLIFRKSVVVFLHFQMNWYIHIAHIYNNESYSDNNWTENITCNHNEILTLWHFHSYHKIIAYMLFDLDKMCDLLWFGNNNLRYNSINRCNPCFSKNV